MQAGRRLRAQRPLPRRHPPARRHRGHAGLRPTPRRTRDPVLRRLARPPRRDRRHHARLDARDQHAGSRRRACCSTTGCWSRTAGCREAETLAPARQRRRTRRATPATNLADLRAQIAANEKGVEELRPDGRPVRPGRGAAPTCGTCRTTPRRRCAGVIDRAAATASTATRLDNGAVIRVAVTGATAQAQRRRSTSPAPRRSSPDNFNAPVVGGDGRRAVRLPHAGGRRHPAQRRLPEAAARSIIPQGSMLAPALPGRRGRPATWRPRRRSPARCTPRSASRPRARAR